MLSHTATVPLPLTATATSDRGSFCAPVLDEWCAHQCGRTDLVASGARLGDRPCCSVSRRKGPPVCFAACPLRTRQWGWPAERSLLREQQQCSSMADPPLNTTVTGGDAARFREIFLCKDEAPSFRAGERAAARHRISFAFIVRDGGEFLDRNMWALADLGHAFADWRLYYVENDSRDGTRRILASFARRFPGRVTGESLDGFSPSPSAFLCPPRANAMNCLERTALLAALRQRLLRLVLARGFGSTRPSSASDVLLMCDIDFVSFSRPNYLRAFAKAVHYRAAAFFASSVYKDRWGILQPCACAGIDPRIIL